MTHQLVYISSAQIDDLGAEVDQILDASRRNNAANSVTGMLLFAQGTFFQVLEGEEDDVRAVYRRISKDPRHSDVITLLDQDVSERQFAEWSMGWSRIPSDHPAAAEIAHLGKPDAHGAAETETMVDTLIESFFQLNQV